MSSFNERFNERYPYVRSEHAPCCDKQVCAYSLGGAACRAERRQAITIANETAKTLGPSWKPKVNQNLGWHAKAISACERWKVHANVYKDKIEGYTAFLGEAGSPSGIWAESGKTPQEAVENTRAKARTEIDYYRGLLDMIENA